MFDLRNAIQQFKEITSALINCLETEDYDSLDETISKRKMLIDEIDKSTFDKELFKKLCGEYHIIELNSKVNSLMTEKLNSIRTEIKKISLQKNVNSNYNVNATVDSIFFNKKI